MTGNVPEIRQDYVAHGPTYRRLARRFGFTYAVLAVLMGMLAMSSTSAAKLPEPTTQLQMHLPSTSSYLPRSGPLRVHFTHDTVHDLRGLQVTASTTLLNSQKVPVGQTTHQELTITRGGYVDIAYDGMVLFATTLQLRVSFEGSPLIAPTSTSLRNYSLGGGIQLQFQPPRTATLQQTGSLVIPMSGYPVGGRSTVVNELVRMHVTVGGEQFTFRGRTNGHRAVISYELPDSVEGQRAEVVFSMGLTKDLNAASSAPRTYKIVK